MNRQIKFKAKAVSDGKWVYGDLVHTEDDSVCFSVKPDCVIELPRTREDVTHTFVYNSIKVDPKTICQATGICDKDGNPVYDKHGNPFYDNDHILMDDTKAVYRLTWNDFYCCYSLYDLVTGQCAAKNFADYHTDKMIIVGNEYD